MRMFKDENEDVSSVSKRFSKSLDKKKNDAEKWYKTVLKLLKTKDFVSCEEINKNLKK